MSVTRRNTAFAVPDEKPSLPHIEVCILTLEVFLSFRRQQSLSPEKRKNVLHTHSHKLIATVPRPHDSSNLISVHFEHRRFQQSFSHL